METVVRGPNLPPGAIGGLQGYFNVHLGNCVFTKANDLKVLSLIFWNLPRKDTPFFNIPREAKSCTVVCPVVTEWSLFDEYLAEAKTLVVEFTLRSLQWTGSYKIKLPVAESRADATIMPIAFADEFKDIYGHLEMSTWVDVAMPKVLMANNKRRRVGRGHKPEVIVESIADVFDILEKTLSSQGIRLLDVYRFCNKLNTPVADMTSMIDRFVDPDVLMIHRTQFWDLIDWKGSLIFTFADFSNRYKTAKKAMTTVRGGIKMEVPVSIRFEAVYKDLTENGTRTPRMYDEVDARTLIGHLKRCDPDAAAFDECCLLATLFLAFPKQTTWTLDEIKHALRIKTPGEDVDGQTSIAAGAPSSSGGLPEGGAAPTGLQHTSSQQDSKESDSNETEESSTGTESQREEPVEQRKRSGGSSRERSSGKSSSVRRNAKLNVLEEVLNRIVPQTVEPLATLTPIAEVASETKENVEALLDDLIEKCRGLMRPSVSCSACALAMTPASESVASTLPVLVRHEQAVPEDAFRPIVCPPALGLPDDPEVLVRDVLFDALYIKASCPPMTVHQPLSAMRKEGTSDVVVFEKTMGCPRAEKLPDHSGRASVWMLLVLHRLLLEDSESQVTAIVKAKGFSEELRNVQSATDCLIWIPCSPTASSFQLVIELRSHPQDTNRCASGALVGLAKLSIPVVRRDKGRVLVHHLTCPILDLFRNEQTGVVMVSLETRTTQESHPVLMHRPTGARSAAKSFPVKQLKGGTREGSVAVCGQVADPSADVVTPSGQTIRESAGKDDEREKLEIETEQKARMLVTLQDKVRVEILAIKVQLQGAGCYVTCSLEKSSRVTRRSRVVRTEDSSPAFSVDFQHDFLIPEKNTDAWFDQALILKVISVSESSELEEVVGEMHLDLSCLPRFGRICGPMGLLGADLRKAGEVEIDVRLLEAESAPAKQRAPAIDFHYCELEEGSDSLADFPSEEAQIPFRTCSDDENYLVIGGVEEETMSPRSNEIDDLCNMFMQTATTEDRSKRTPIRSADIVEAFDPLYCEDDFMLDISRRDVDGRQEADAEPIDSVRSVCMEREDAAVSEAVNGGASEDELFDAIEDIPIVRVSSDCLGKGKGGSQWKFSTTLPTSPRSSPVQYSDAIPLRPADDTVSPYKEGTTDTTGTGDDAMVAAVSSVRGATNKLNVSASEGNDSTESVDIDDLLEKYNIERRPGWWRSLVTDDAHDPTFNP